MKRTDEKTKEWVEGQYAKPDPWGYQRHPDDKYRRLMVMTACLGLAPDGRFRKALDVGAGEGWITQALPAIEIYGLELSDAAAARFPTSVKRLTDGTHDHSFDLVVSTETMFEHYNWKQIRDAILKAAAPGALIVTCNNTKWEVPAIEKEIGSPLLVQEFPYRGMVMRLKAWRVCAG
jgi:hypothetical protein